MRIVFKKGFYDNMVKSFTESGLLNKAGEPSKHGTGKHYETITIQRKDGTVYQRRQEVGRKKQEKKAKGKTEPKEKGKRAYSRAVGDIVLFKDEKGKTHNGLITARGKDGVTVKYEEKKTLHVPHDNVRRVLAKVNDKDEIRNLYDSRRLTPKFRDGTDGLQPESCDTIKGMWEMAKAAMGDFEKYSENVKAKFSEINPILLKRGELKGEERAKEKLRADEAINQRYGVVGELYNEKTDTYHCRTLRDVDGHTFCCKNIEDVSKMLDYFIGDKKNIIRIKNNFGKPSDVGYSDINMNIRLPNGTIAEIQLNTMANMVAKENYGHTLYEVYRSINENPRFKAVADAMGAAQTKLYELSNKYSKEGNFPTEITNPFGATYQPYAEAIRADLRKALPGIVVAYNAGAINDKTYENVQKLLKKIG